jgi:hypothetical protein
MSYATALSLTVGNYQYTSQVVRLRVSLGLLPSVNRAVATFPAAVVLSASAGDDATVDLLVDSEATTILSGTVHEIGSSMSTRRVVICDGSAELCAARPMKTFEAPQAGDVIRSLSSETGVNVGSVDADLEMPVCVIDQSRNAAEHIASIAALCDCLALVGSDNNLAVTSIPLLADSALRYGRELLEYRVSQRPASRPELVAIGHGPAGSAQAPEALRPTVACLPAGAKDPSAEVQWSAYGLLRTPKAALTAGRALNGIRSRSTQTVEAHCILCPQIRPGIVVEVADAPDRLGSGPWLVSDVVHEVGREQGTTTWWRGWKCGM